MRVVDTHVHLWDRTAQRHTWMNGTDLPVTRTVPDLPEAAPLDREVVLMEVASDPDSALAEASWMSAQVQAHRSVVGFVANLPFTLDVPAALDELDRLPGWCGVRWLFQDRDDLWDDPHTAGVFGLLAEAGVPFDLCVRHQQLPAAVALLRRHPLLTVVLDHCGKPPLTEPGTLRDWEQAITALAGLPQVVCKLSGLTAEANGLDETAAVPRYRQVVQHCLDSFGAERCLVGSDWPISPLLQGRAAAWFELVADLAGSQADQVMAGTADRVYRLTGSE